jgi:hypothetical protein
MGSKRKLIHAVIDTSYLIKHYGDDSWKSNRRLGLDTLNGQVAYHVPVIVLKEIAGLITSRRGEVSERARSVRGNLLKLRGRFDEPSIDPKPVQVTDPLGADSVVDRKLLAIAEAYLETDPGVRVILLTNDCGIKRSVLARHSRRNRFIRGWHENTCRVAALSISEAKNNTDDARSRTNSARQSAVIQYSGNFPSSPSRSEVVDTHGLRVRDMGLLDILFHVVLAAVIACGLIGVFAHFLPDIPKTSGRRPGTADTPWPAVATDKAGSGLSERIRLSVDAAQNRNEQAHRLCESEVNIILAREFQEIERQGNLAAENLSTYGSCCNIIYRLAKEQIWSSGASVQPAAPPGSPLRVASSSKAYVQDGVLKEVQPVLDACAGELNTALDRYERALRTSTTTLAYELAQAGAGAASMPSEIQAGMPTQRDVDTALRNLGFDGVSIAVSSAFDIPAILNSTLLSGIVGKASQLAATTFARPAAAAAGSAVVAAADGPLPVGDGIALLGGAGIALQIYSARAEFEKAIKESLAKALPEMKRDVYSQVVERIHVLQAAYQQAQDEIRNQSVSTLGH